MSRIDVDALLRAVEPDAPCGPNLEYDPVFVALEQAVLGKPEVQYGATISAAVPPDWKLVRRMAADLLARSRDLRLVVHLLRANLALDGIDGLADAIRLIERLLDEQWQAVHPELDADDDMDPMLRLNSLAILADRATVLKEVKEATLLVLPGLGPFSLRTLDVATGELAPADGQDKVSLASIELALADADAAALGAAADALQRSHDSVLNIETLLVRQVGSSQALNLDALTRALKRGADFLAQQLAARQGAAAPAVEGDPVAPAAPGAAPRQAPAGEIGGRDDVVRALDRLIDYYRHSEPSSPVPLLLERARRLVSKNFFEIMEDLAPEGMAQLKLIRGPDGAKP
ncbi:MAG TPA: type VI secretion system protein TssA [Telluria sp.]|nr:type VI secretion system protein TssA [Telluria sp.]